MVSGGFIPAMPAVPPDSFPTFRLIPCSARCAYQSLGPGKILPKMAASIWVEVKELKLRYYIGETLFFTIYIYIPIMVT